MCLSIAIPCLPFMAQENRVPVGPQSRELSDTQSKVGALCLQLSHWWLQEAMLSVQTRMEECRKKAVVF